METIALKQELEYFIKNSDDKSIAEFYEVAKSYLIQFQKDQIIAASETDISNDAVFSQQEVLTMISNWKE